MFRYTVECSPGDFHISCTYEGTTCGGFDPVGSRSFGVLRRLSFYLCSRSSPVFVPLCSKTVNICVRVCVSLSQYWSLWCRLAVGSMCPCEINMFFNSNAAFLSVDIFLFPKKKKI